MRKIKIKAVPWVGLVLLIVFSMQACVSYRTAGQSGKVPPGQAKKIYGTKSAKDFAPGHNK